MRTYTVVQVVEAHLSRCWQRNRHRVKRSHSKLFCAHSTDEGNARENQEASWLDLLKHNDNRGESENEDGQTSPSFWACKRIHNPYLAMRYPKRASCTHPPTATSARPGAEASLHPPPPLPYHHLTPHPLAPPHPTNYSHRQTCGSSGAEERCRHQRGGTGPTPGRSRS